LKLGNPLLFVFTNGELGMGTLKTQHFCLTAQMILAGLIHNNAWVVSEGEFILCE
jgi:hypothetical protein